LSDLSRFSTYRSIFRITTDNPWFGTGLGTFAPAFPPYRTDDVSMQGIWDIGHSTPLELMSEMGIPFALIIGAAWIVALAILLLGALAERRSKTVLLSALTVALIGLAHSCLDFSLQVAGYSIVAFALLGLGLSRAVSSPARVPKPRLKRA
jgi:O-antigen ligase